METLFELDDKASILQSSKSNEWYTPRKYIEAARYVMSGIDLDPASCQLANQTVQAATFYTKEENGFDKPWHGRIWLNPPYGVTDGKSNQERWSCRLIAQYEAGITLEAVLLVNAVTAEKWFQRLWQYPICFTDHRIRFYGANSELASPTHGNAFVYFGKNIEKFEHVFTQFGRVVPPVQPSQISTLWDEVAN